jgi:hypothetical protein
MRGGVGLTKLEILTACKLAERADQRTLTVRLSAKEIATATEQSAASVWKSLRGLDAKGWIERVRRGGGAWNPNEWRLRWPG